MNRLSALKLAYCIITDKRNSNRYCSTKIINNKTGEFEADYGDAVTVIEELYKEEMERQNNQSSRINRDVKEV